MEILSRAKSMFLGGAIAGDLGSKLSSQLPNGKLNLPAAVGAGMGAEVATTGGSMFTVTNTAIFLSIVAVGLIIMQYLGFNVLKMVGYNASGYSPNNEHTSGVSGAGGGNGQPNNTAEILLFSASWCPVCKNAEPYWRDFRGEYEGKVINGYKLLFTEVDCSDDASEEPQLVSLMEQFQVTGYPTIKLVKDKTIVGFDAAVTKENLEQFINSML